MSALIRALFVVLAFGCASIPIVGARTPKGVDEKQTTDPTWASTVGRVAPALPAPGGITAMTAVDGGLPVSFSIAGTARSVWLPWRAALEAAGFTVAEVLVNDEAQITAHIDGPRGGRGSVSLTGRDTNVRGGIDWVDRPRPPRLTSPCVVPPQREFRMSIVAPEAHPPPDREEPQALVRGYGSQRALDVDGDGRLDMVVPNVGPTSCPHQIEYTIYVMRGACGHAVGTVLGFPRPAGPRRAGALRDLSTNRHWSVITDTSRPPGPRNVATRHEVLTPYVARAGAYAAGPPTERTGICHHCGIEECRRISGP